MERRPKVRVDIDVGDLECPKCKQKLHLLHREYPSPRKKPFHYVLERV